MRLPADRRPGAHNQEKAAAASPVTYASKDAAPFLIMHGDKDDGVPISQSERMAEALRKAGAEVKFQRVAGARHGGPEFLTPENRRLIEEFFAKHLKSSRTK